MASWPIPMPAASTPLLPTPSDSPRSVRHHQSGLGDSYDNALAESFNGLYKTELTKRRGPWRNAEHLETETMPYINWFNNRRLHSEIGDIPPTEFEATYYAHLRSTTQHPTPPAM
jgi:transposase InsO family protein